MEKEYKDYIYSEAFIKDLMSHKTPSEGTLTLINTITAQMNSLDATLQKSLNIMKGEIKENTNFRIATIAVFSNMKYWASFLGISNIATLIYFIASK